jgi:hypothetical protein
MPELLEYIVATYGNKASKILQLEEIKELIQEQLELDSRFEELGYVLKYYQEQLKKEL